jgi:Dyggve-Melchior-Clausen syndrome protein
MHNASAPPATDVEARPATAATPEATAAAGSSNASVQAPFSQLLDTVVTRLGDPATLLLLYDLLVHCKPFLDTVLVRSDIDALLLPLLEQLYGASAEQPHHLYLLQVRFAMLCKYRVRGSWCEI